MKLLGFSGSSKQIESGQNTVSTITLYTHTQIYMHTYSNDHYAPLMQWSLPKYKCLWGVEGKD